MRCSAASIFLCIAIAITVNANGQKKLVVMGSSTAAGTGASSYPNCWVAKTQAYYRQNSFDSQDTVVINIALGGQTTYNQLPNGLAAVPGRPYPPDTARNVNKALSFNPDVIIINLPSNDIASGFSKEEFMANLRMMYSTIVNAGVKCYISTTQPRTLSDIQRQMQRSLVDSIINVFGYYSINFWTDIATPDNYIKPEVSFGDGIHVNDAGHNFLYLSVKNKAVFAASTPLPVKLTAFNARLSNNTTVISWQTEQEEPNTFYEVQRSGDGQNFVPLNRMQAMLLPRASYSFSDRQPLAGKSFYRLKIIETAKETYSNTIVINNKVGELNINRIYSAQTPGNLLAEISVQKSQPVEISIINSTGSTVVKYSQFISGPASKINLVTGNLPGGTYFLCVKTAANLHAVKAFNL